MMTSNMPFVNDEEIAWEEAGPGVRRKVMAYEPGLMMVKVAFEAGGIGAAHKHPHSQMSYVESGRFEISIGDETRVLKAGDVYHIPSGVRHSALALEAGVLIDVFTPMREDFV